MTARDEHHAEISQRLHEERRTRNRFTVGTDEDEERHQEAERKELSAAATRYFDKAPFDALANALASLPKGTLWCVGSMEDGPFARVILPQPNGGYSGGYREATGDTPVQALAYALAAVAGRGL